MTVVLSLGGSVINGTGEPDTRFISRFSDIIKKISKKEKIVIITGGGYIARAYPNVMRKFNISEIECDEVGILATRLNAAYVIRILNAKGVNVYPEYLSSCDFTVKLRDVLNRYNVVVTGGVSPGMTSDADSVILSIASNAKRLVNVSNVNGVYDSDPNKNPKAKKINKMNHRELLEIVFRSATGMAGEHIIFDMLGTKLALIHNIELHFVKGQNYTDVENAILGKKHNGTIVRD